VLLSFQGSTASPTYRLYLTYFDNGSVKTYNDTVEGSWAYTYDVFNRLATAANASTGNAYSYSYDQFGNRWHQTVTAGTGLNVNYTFNSSNRNTSTGFAYDVAGNLTSDGSGCTSCWTYDYAGNLTADYWGANFTYDGMGNRVQRTYGGTTNDFVLGPDGSPFDEYQGTVHSRVTGGLFTYANGITYFNHTDHEGTPRVTTDYTGTVKRTEANLPFGDGFTDTATSFIDYSGFAGGMRDTETNGDHFGAREYAKTQGRWLTPDPAGLGAVDLSDPQSWNPYSYVTNQPCTLIDPFGLSECNFNIAVNGQSLTTSSEWNSAWSELNRILSLANLGAVLTNGDSADFTVNLKNNPTGLWGELSGEDWNTVGTNDSWFGAPGNSASVWVNSTEMAAAGMNIGTALGRVMTHEFGHWALNMVHMYPTPGPLETGIMTQGLGPTLMTGLATLTPEQMSRLRSRCKERHGGATSGSGSAGYYPSGSWVWVDSTGCIGESCSWSFQGYIYYSAHSWVHRK
jgi:RHS repeat-associated protein